MRIVIDARESGTSTGRYVDKLIQYLNKLKPDHEILVLTKSHRLEFVRSVAPDFKVIKSDYKEFTFAEQLGLYRQLKSLGADLVHFAMDRQPILYRGKVIATMHDLTTARYDNPSKNALVFKFKQIVYKKVLKDVAKKSAYIITPSKYVKHDVAQYADVSPDKIFVTYEAADLIKEVAQAVPRLKDKQFIMYVGRPLPHKNLKRLVDAFIILKKKYPKLMLVLAGKMDTNYHRLEGYVTEKRMADSVVFTGFVTEGELKWLYQNTAAYVFPSLSEGFGLPGLEAMMHGAPVVSSDATCLPEIYGDSAYYFDPNNTFDIASKISNVLSSAGIRAELIRKGKSRAAQFSWDRMARQTLKLYEKV